MQEELRETMLTDGGVPQGTGLNTSPALAERSKSGCPAIMPRLFPQGSDGGADELLQRLATGWEQQGSAQRHTVRARLHSMGLVLRGCGGAGVGAWRQRPSYSDRAPWVFGITVGQPKVLGWAQSPGGTFVPVVGMGPSQTLPSAHYELPGDSETLGRPGVHTKMDRKVL